MRRCTSRCCTVKLLGARGTVGQLWQRCTRSHSLLQRVRWDASSALRPTSLTSPHLPRRRSRRRRSSRRRLRSRRPSSRSRASRTTATGWRVCACRRPSTRARDCRREPRWASASGPSTTRRPLPRNRRRRSPRPRRSRPGAQEGGREPEGARAAVGARRGAGGEEALGRLGRRRRRAARAAAAPAEEVGQGAQGGAREPAEAQGPERRRPPRGVPVHQGRAPGLRRQARLQGAQR